ncbi:nitrate reductase molybdenum cofactor assembly chaperone [Zophobihabitans entericus]|uniref:Nitrate reductase molybdenum cofactor assembly chaperone n=1 Tax=Zophobihabitans entericus TaxID=1635327 RepID=A0A6G9IBT6_9GAMM|nr:nitrate reductase molybdenum cofactor assembly chaperone [Zophobihabitans entericus]QIQ21691.1 nitrate reductase molybdenum cofactor assembly chaperone [Zophobihabitans entericus]
MKSLMIISCLLEHPTKEIWQAKDELLTEVATCDELSVEQKHQLMSFIQTYLSMPLLEAQSLYCETFDLGQVTSLLIFEHVHGDSRERGQAMVELMNHYQQAGLMLHDQKQLPDYLPLFLEFIAQLPVDKQPSWLHGIATVIRLLEMRLEKKESIYQSLFTLLFALSATQVDEPTLQQQVAQEEVSYTPQMLDKIWQEEQILFQAGSSCQDNIAAKNRNYMQAPVYYIDMDEDKRSRA